METRRRYLQKLSATFVGAIAISAAINLVIDPYGTFRLLEIGALNRIKPYPDHDLATIKTHALRHVLPDALILGNSRAEVGFDPSHPVWREAGYRSVYNAALPGTSPGAALALLQNAARRRPPKFILLGIDFFDFPIALYDLPGPARGVNENGLDDLRWMLRATMTMQALLDSITTVRRQYQRNPEQLTVLGHNPLLEYHDIAKAEGYWTLFRQRAEENAKNHGRKPANLFLKGTQSSPHFDDVRRIVRWAAENDAELRLVIYPYHAQLLIMIDELGLWPLFEEWKRQIHRIVAGEQASASNRISLIDFSGFSSYAQDPIPPKGDKKTPTRWFWEAGHFKRELGDIMLPQCVSGGAKEFGIALTGRNIEQHLAQLSAGKRDFRTGNSAMVAEISDLVRTH